MEDFTPNQILDITRSYCDMARALNEYQLLHWPELSHEQQLDLNAYQNSLLNRSQDLQSHAARPAFTDAVDIATRIQQATAEAQTSLSRIGDPVIALNVGAITVALAAYVARANLRGIQTALRELEDLVK
ncbi:hypothetical protein [Spirosoma gilvum]